MPLELALYIAIEAERALDEAIQVTGGDRIELVAWLDAAARDEPETGPRHTFVRPLDQYADAIGRGSIESRARCRSVARVPHRVAAAWAHAAGAAGVPLATWVVAQLSCSSADRVPWEAAAARTGRTLAEWVLVQAARCARSRSTSPQTAASG